MHGIKKKKNESESIADIAGTFFSGLFETLESIFEIFEKAFDDLPLGTPLIVLAIIGMLIYYAVFFRIFNARDMLIFIYFFVGGIVLLALMILYKFSEIFEPYLLYRAATRKRREESRRILETHRIMRQIVKKKRKHKEISANDVLVPPKDNKQQDTDPI